ncbi:GNAT family N-acetyltransferase [Rossellomorea aquimaris]|uniref:GNAT family N-acetyltransferase n=1 Tax=Rossellomorea aquimaris TaxID=189382 RepID=UPI001CD2E8D1|nr:GNAT family protein [Rossellomorea aquimaris]MCA1058965.1 GNAT family N-acetyltransferase [Rossellomorea aquimaris]
MSFTFQMMTQEQAECIANTWKYEGEYAFYDISADEEDLAEFLDEGRRGNATFSVLNEGKLVGFFSFIDLNDGTIEIGLGMKPGMTGKGKGQEFTEAGLEFARSKYSPSAFSLSVATFNQRAIKVYKKSGFTALGTFIQKTNGGSHEFLKMEYHL